MIEVEGNHLVTLHASKEFLIITCNVYSNINYYIYLAGMYHSNFTLYFWTIRIWHLGSCSQEHGCKESCATDHTFSSKLLS